MDWNYEKQLGQNIARLRSTAGLTQEQLAAQLQIRSCEIDRSALSKMESGGRHIYPDEIKMIRELLHVSYDELFV